MIDRLSTYRFCPTVEDALNLQQEKLTNNNFVVGNTVIDSLPKILSEKNNDIYITLHRRENHSILNEWFFELEHLANTYPEYNFYFIKHPNPNVLKNISIFNKVKVIDPFPHEKMIMIIAKKCLLFISDSGGIQEELSHYDKPIIVCRKHTERNHPGVIMAHHPKDLTNAFKNAKDKYTKTHGWFGYGESGKEIVNILMNKVINK
jgi:UDP-N-acetylglucosamine 2-epimerase (non-hydrolysing)